MIIIIIICCDTQPDSSTERGEKMRKSTFELVSWRALNMAPQAMF